MLKQNLYEKVPESSRVGTLRLDATVQRGNHGEFAPPSPERMHVSKKMQCQNFDTKFIRKVPKSSTLRLEAPIARGNRGEFAPSGQGLTVESFKMSLFTILFCFFPVTKSFKGAARRERSTTGLHRRHFVGDRRKLPATT